MFRRCFACEMHWYIPYELNKNKSGLDQANTRGYYNSWAIYAHVEIQIYHIWYIILVDQTYKKYFNAYLYSKYSNFCLFY